MSQKSCPWEVRLKYVINLKPRQVKDTFQREPFPHCRISTLFFLFQIKNDFLWSCSHTLIHKPCSWGFLNTEIKCFEGHINIWKRLFNILQISRDFAHKFTNFTIFDCQHSLIIATWKTRKQWMCCYFVFSIISHVWRQS